MVQGDVMPTIVVKYKDGKVYRFQETQSLLEKQRGFGNQVIYETGFVKIVPIHGNVVSINSDLIEKITYE